MWRWIGIQHRTIWSDRSNQSGNSLHFTCIIGCECTSEGFPQHLANLGIGHTDELITNRRSGIIRCELLGRFMEENMIGGLLKEVELLISIGAKVEKHLIIEKKVLVRRISSR